ncbi:MAG: F0F1 ATP synthase subunit B [Armatimonadota bacterium]
MELFHALGIEPGIIAVNIAGFVLLVLLLKRFAFGPVGEILEERAREIKSSLEDAERAHQMALADKRAMEEQLAGLDERAQEIVAQAQTEAERRRAEILQHANEQSRRIVEDGRRAVERAEEEARQRLREQTAEIAVAVSERALRASIDEERQAAIVEAFIADLERLAREEGERA